MVRVLEEKNDTHNTFALVNCSCTLAWNMSTVSFCWRDCSTPGAILRRNDTMASLDMIFAAWK